MNYCAGKDGDNRVISLMRAEDESCGLTKRQSILGRELLSEVSVAKLIIDILVSHGDFERGGMTAFPNHEADNGYHRHAK